jgi:hypothetical protein
LQQASICAIIGADFWILGQGVHITVSRQALEAIIGRAILDEEFRLALFADPETALIGFELTEDEMSALKQLDAESLDACGDTLGRRITIGMHRVRKEQGATHGSTEKQTISSG